MKRETLFTVGSEFVRQIGRASIYRIICTTDLWAILRRSKFKFWNLDFVSRKFLVSSDFISAFFGLSGRIRFVPHEWAVGRREKI